MSNEQLVNRYLNAAKDANNNESDLFDGKAFSFMMLRALFEMSINDVVPDDRFSDREYAVWALIHNATGKKGAKR